MPSSQTSEPAGTAARMFWTAIPVGGDACEGRSGRHLAWIWCWTVEAGPDALHRRLSDALLVQLQGGSDAPILQMEVEVRAAGMLSGPASMELCLGRHPCVVQPQHLSTTFAVARPPTPQTFIAAGAPPNPDLAELVASPTPGNSTLYPAGGQC